MSGIVPGSAECRPRVHLVNAFDNPNGGSEQRALGLYRALKGWADVRLWSVKDPHPAFQSEVTIRRIASDGVPEGGTLVFVSFYYDVGAWFDRLRPERLIVIYNVDNPIRLRAWLKRISKLWRPRPELVFASHALRESTGLSGQVQLSPIDVQRFAFERDPMRYQRGACVVGRLSRDVLEKHHPDDIALYRQLAARGFRIRIMGGTLLAPALAEISGIELLPEGVEPAEVFLASLDIFIYRTNDMWFEAHGRVVSEAMASGLPVVCHARGGYAESIRHGKNGLLYTAQEQALGHIETLRADAGLRASLGRAARESVEAEYGESCQQNLLRFYLPPQENGIPTDLRISNLLTLREWLRFRVDALWLRAHGFAKRVKNRAG